MKAFQINLSWIPAFAGMTIFNCATVQKESAFCELQTTKSALDLVKRGVQPSCEVSPWLTLYFQGLRLTKEEHFHEADLALLKSLELAPQSAQSAIKYRRAVALMLDSHQAQAQSLLEELIVEQTDQKSNAIRLLALIFASKDPKLTPTNQALLDEAYSAIQAQNLTLEQAQRIFALADEMPLISVLLAASSVALQLGFTTDAVNYLNKAMEINPEDPRPVQLLAIIEGQSTARSIVEPGPAHHR